MHVLRTKLTPPRLHSRILPRPRLTARLLEAVDYRLTVVQAEAGYGKSTALAALAEDELLLAWYHLDAEDDDPSIFWHHLVHSVRHALPEVSDAALVALEEWEGEGSEGRWTTTVDALVNDLDRQLRRPLLLVLDDVHHLSQSSSVLQALDRLIGHAPADVHVILSTRHPLPLPSLVGWRLRGEILEMGRDELAFTPDEIAALFARHYGIQLTKDETERLCAETEGWAIALPLIWQELAPPVPGHLATPLDRTRLARGLLAATTGDLFTYLAQEVLSRQPAPIVAFLKQTAVLRELTPEICDCLRGAADGELILRQLLDGGLFLVGFGHGQARYHHLFREFLLAQLEPAAAAAAHRQAALCYEQQGRREDAIQHFLAAGAGEEAARLLRTLGRAMVRAGRLDTLTDWIQALSPQVLESHAPLMAYLGDVARLHSRFAEALGWYEQAEARCRALGDMQGVGQALRGQARVYLDTVNPSQAEHLLQEALRLSDGDEDRETRIRLLELLAENRLNLGRVEDAERFQAQASLLREQAPTEADVAVRVLIRTGRLAEARAILEAQAQAERGEPVLRPRAHRETMLLLSLILSLQGEGEAAYRCAVEGAQRGEALRSPFISAVGAMRQGHAWYVKDPILAAEQARQAFFQAIALADQLAVPRLKVEAYWGLCRVHGFAGNLPAAEEAASQGIAIAQHTGDEWITALIRLTLAGGYCLARRYGEATALLSDAAMMFRECDDTFGETAARLWQCLAWLGLGDVPRLARDVDELMRAVREHGYGFLFLRRTLLGPPDPRQLVPLLVHARTMPRQRTFAGALLAQLGLSRVEVHPGYQLRLQTLGPLRAWRGEQEIGAQDWRRDKARQLFLLLVTQRQRMLERDQIVEMLWPGLSADAAERDFKVALTTLVRVLEPELAARAPSAYVLREGTLYGLRPGADLALDAAQFEQWVAEGDRLAGQGDEAFLEHYRTALAVYGGDFLQEYPYEEWCSEERERLLGLWLHAADRLAAALAERERWQEAVDVCQAILQRDECWEQAYRVLMLAHARLGNRAQALRTYQRCIERLRAELDVPPSVATVGLFEELRVG